MIANTAEGAKYGAALLFQKGDDSSKPFFIVKPSWLDECAERKDRVDEADHLLVTTVAADSEDDSNDENDIATASTADTKVDSPASLPNALNQLLQTYSGPDPLFSACQFYLIGFQEDTDVFRDLTRLIRRGMGTIYWEFQEAVTHVIVNDAQIEESARLVT